MNDFKIVQLDLKDGQRQIIKFALAYLRPDFLGPQDMGHKDVATGCGVLSL